MFGTMRRFVVLTDSNAGNLIGAMLTTISIALMSARSAQANFVSDTTMKVNTIIIILKR